MVAALFGCWFHVGGVRSAVAGPVISVRPVSAPGIEARRVPGGWPSLLRPLPRRPRAKSCGRGRGAGQRSVPVLLCCMCARVCLHVFLGVWMYVCVGVVCVSVPCAYVGWCVRTLASCLYTSTVCMSVCV